MAKYEAYHMYTNGYGMGNDDGIVVRPDGLIELKKGRFRPCEHGDPWGDTRAEIMAGIKMEVMDNGGEKYFRTEVYDVPSKNQSIVICNQGKYIFLVEPMLEPLVTNPTDDPNWIPLC